MLLPPPPAIARVERWGGVEDSDEDDQEGGDSSTLEGGGAGAAGAGAGAGASGGGGFDGVEGEHVHEPTDALGYEGALHLYFKKRNTRVHEAADVSVGAHGCVGWGGVGYYLSL